MGWPTTRGDWSGWRLGRGVVKGCFLRSKKLVTLAVATLDISRDRYANKTRAEHLFGAFALAASDTPLGVPHTTLNTDTILLDVDTIPLDSVHYNRIESTLEQGGVP